MDNLYSPRMLVGALLVLLLLIPVSTADAQPEAPREPGTRQPPSQVPPGVRGKGYATEGVWEIGGSATFQYFTPVVDGSTGDAITIVTASPYVGWFVFDGLAVGAYPAGVVLTSGGGTTVTQMRFFAAPSFTLRSRLLVYPYVEGLAGYALEITSVSGRTATSGGFSWGGSAGIKIPITDNGLLVVGAQYLAITLNPAGAPRRNGSNELAGTAGFTLWF